MSAYRNTALIAVGNVFFKYRNALFPLLVLLLLAFPPRGGLEWFGLALLLAGQALRFATIGYQYIERGGKDKKVYAKDLVTGGLFSACRNPLYVGNLLIYTGVFAVHGNPASLAAGAALFLFAYVAIVAAEENYLRGRFGEAYDRYCADVARWLPDFRRLPEATAGMRFDVRRMLRKDYSTCGAWMLAGCVLMAYKAVALQGRAAAEPELIAWGTAFVAVLLLIGATRGLKKSGRLA